MDLFKIKCPIIVLKNDVIVAKRKLNNLSISNIKGPLKNINGKWEMQWQQKDGTDKHYEIKKLSVHKDGKQTIIELDYGFFFRTIFCLPAKYNESKCVDLFIAVSGNCFCYNNETLRVSRQVIKAVDEENDKEGVRQLVKLNTFVSNRKNEKDLFTGFLCYDVETCADSRNQHKVYLAYVNFYDAAGVLKESKRFAFDDRVDKLWISNEEYCFESYDFAQDFGDWFRDRFIMSQDEDLSTEMNFFTTQNICLFGFNNSRFDNHFIYDYFLKNFQMEYQERFGKVTMGVFKYNHITVRVCDLVSWLPEKSLAESLEEYECGAKDDVNIVAFNNYFKQENYQMNKIRACTKEILYSFLKDHCTSLTKMRLALKFKNPDGTYDAFKMVDDYCAQDVKATWTLYSKIQENFAILINDFKDVSFYPNMFNYISPSQVAGVMLNHHLDKETRRLTFLSEDYFKFINSSFFGGRVDFGCIGEYHAKEVCCLDVTSMYSVAMTANFPVLQDYEDIKIEKYDPTVFFRINQIIKSNMCLQKLFVCMCNVEMPEDKTKMCSFGPIPERFEGKLDFPNKNFYQKILTSVHIHTAQLCGYKVTCVPYLYNTLFLKSGPILNDLVRDMIARKAAAKESNKALGKLLKLLANSYHGKLAQKVEAKMHLFTKSRKLIKNNRVETLDIKSSRVYLATFVTSYANLVLMEAFLRVEQTQRDNKIPIEDRKGTLLYCDTDSIFFTLHDEAILKDFTISESLGKFDDSTMSFNATWSRKYTGANGMIILGKKSYFVFTKTNDNFTILDLKLKGVHKNEMSQFTRDVVLDHIIRPFIRNLQTMGDSSSKGVLLTRTILKRKLQDDRQIEFNGLLRTAQKFDCFDGNSEQSFVKDIYETVLKKTLRVNVSSSKKVLKIENDNLIFYFA